MGKRKCRKFIDPKKDVLHKFSLNSKKGFEDQKLPESLFGKPSCLVNHNSKSSAASDDPLDFSAYGIYFNDGYDYGQHLKETNYVASNDENVEIDTVLVPHPQAKKQEEVEVTPSELNDMVVYGQPSISTIDNGMIEYVVTDDVPVDADDLFGEESEGDELPDNIVDLLDGADADEEYETDDSSEEVSDGFSNHDGSFNVSDDEDGSDLPAAGDETLYQRRSRSIADGGKANSFAEVNRFFDTITEDCIECDDEFNDATPLLLSSSTILPSTSQVEMLNDRLQTMLVRDSGSFDLINTELADGALSEEGPQFRAAATSFMNDFVDKEEETNKRNKYGEAKVMLIGSQASFDTDPDDVDLRRRALDFCRAWRETKDELVEVAVPDRRAMKYDVTNLPVIRNKNKPALITATELTSYGIGSKKKKGLTVKDLKMHDVLVNAPKSSGNEETQTYKTMLSELSYRPPDESTDERRLRKTAVKVLRKGRREEKKCNQLAHKAMYSSVTRTNLNARPYRTISLL